MREWPRLVNAITHNRMARHAARMLGLTALPALGTTDLRAELVRRGFQQARHFGIELEIVASGCCGMAGLYGHEVANRKTSEAIYGLSWGPILGHPDHRSRISATGYSCRCQARLMDGIRLDHPVQELLRMLKERPSEGPVQPAGQQTRPGRG